MIETESTEQSHDEGPTVGQLPRGFSLEADGIYYQAAKQEGDKDKPVKHWVCMPFTPLAMLADREGNEPSTAIGWVDAQGNVKQYVIPRATLHENGAIIAKELTERGLEVDTDPDSHRAFKRLITNWKSTRSMVSTKICGWADNEVAFILPNGKMFARGPTEFLLVVDFKNKQDYIPRGSLDEWQESIAARAVGNDYLVLALCIAFAGPLLRFAFDSVGIGFHFYGQSRKGKSTLLILARSVWAWSETLETWHATAVGLETAAVETCDTLTVRDEINRVESQTLFDAAYMLTDGRGKDRGTVAKTLHSSAIARQDALTWRCNLLSSGEQSIEQKLAESGIQIKQGQRARVIDLLVTDNGHGAFQRLPDSVTAHDFADQLKDAARRCHGRAGERFLERIVAAAPETVESVLKADIAKFQRDYVPEGADSQVIDAAKRFGLCAAAGELAACFGVLNWPKDTAFVAVGRVFKRWLAARGSIGSGEELDAINQVRAIVETHGSSRFEFCGSQADRSMGLHEELQRTNNRLGFRVVEDDETEYWFLSETWKNEACKGRDPTAVAKVLADRGWLIKNERDQYASSKYIPALRKSVRVYRVRGAILEG
ncbi:MAG TPA: DUF927 domain-containing protein [Acetobacteraceae bacterium]|nr:DUF927 domain-containing protein [Acetobacteraceae bacterium]